MIKHIGKQGSWIVVLAISAICISLASASFSVYVYFNTPKQINSYVQAHKNELKGATGKQGDIGPPGFNGVSGSPGATGSSGISTPLNCSTYSATPQYSSTNCN